MEVDGLPPSFILFYFILFLKSFILNLIAKPDSDYAEFTKEDLAFMLRKKKKIIMVKNLFLF